MANKTSKSAAADQATTTRPKSVKSTATMKLPERAKPRLLPQYKVILHNDDKNDFEHVIASVVMLCGMNRQDAQQRAVEAHATGYALLLVTHKERAELYVDQFRSCSLTVTIEPAE